MITSPSRTTDRTATLIDHVQRDHLFTTLRKVSLFRAILVRIFPYSNWIRRDTSYSGQMPENTDQNNSEYKHFLYSGT